MRSAWAWVSCSEALLACLLLATPAPAGAGVYLSQAEALELAFPGADRVEKRVFLLDDAQVERIEALARAPLESRIVAVWEGFEGDARLGHAFIDVHVVRTLTQGLLVVLDPRGTVRSVRVLAFHEPEEYLPREGWFEQFVGRDLGPGLRIDRDIHGVVGATLSARAVTRSVRRSLALYRVLLAAQPAKDEKGD